MQGKPQVNLVVCWLLLASAFAVVSGGDAQPPQVWEVLGPFPAGSREVGADPVEAFGGIEKVYSFKSPSQRFSSEVAANGTAKWLTFQSESSGDGVVSVSFKYPESPWDLLSSALGSAGLLFQAWAVGTFDVDIQGEGRYRVECALVGSVRVDGVTHNCDPYGTGKSLSFQYISAGTHRVLVHISGQQEAGLSLSFHRVENGAPDLEVLAGDVIVPDVVGDVLAGTKISVSVVNGCTRSATASATAQEEVDVEDERLETACDILIEGVSSRNSSLVAVSLSSPGSVFVKANQATSVAIDVRLHDSANATHICMAGVLVMVHYRRSGGPNGLQVVEHLVKPQCRSFGDAFTYTFVDFDGSVQYAAAVPPADGCGQSCPVLLATHGASVQAQSPAWTGAFKQQSRAWIILPTNRRRYGFDWQGPGQLNAIYAMEALAKFQYGVPADLKAVFGVDTNRVLYTGHSMGGHGCLVMATHYPDTALAVAAASGWIQSELYMPFYTRLGDGRAGPRMMELLSAALAEYDIEGYLDNLAGTPMMVRNGAADDVVPPWHLVRVARMMDEINGSPQSVVVSEVPNEGHWFDGVVGGKDMQEFFDAHLLSAKLPPLPTTFQVVSASPSSAGPRGFIRILQTSLPARSGRIHVTSKGSAWYLRTENVRRFTFVEPSVAERQLPKSVIVDGVDFGHEFPSSSSAHLCRLDDSGWSLCTDDAWAQKEKGPVLAGPAAKVWDGPVVVIYGTATSSVVYRNLLRRRAVLLASEMHSRGRFAVQVRADHEVEASPDISIGANLVVIGGHSENTIAAKLAAEIESRKAMSFSHDNKGLCWKISAREFCGPGLGLLVLTPFRSASLGTLRESLQKAKAVRSSFAPDYAYNHVGIALILAGSDESGFKKAMGAIPSKSGIQIPDYVVMGPRFGYAGAAGMLAAGYWGNDWSYSHALSAFHVE